MTYITVKKVIFNKKAALSSEEWEAFRIETMSKLDVFLLNNRLTDQEYNELMELLTE